MDGCHFDACRTLLFIDQRTVFLQSGRCRMRFFENVLEAGKGIKCAKHENKKSKIIIKDLIV